MSSDPLSSLRQRKSSVNQDIGNARQRISAAQDKISRLQTVSSSLQTSIYSLRNLKSDIDDFEIAKSKWEGERKNQFRSKYNSYNIFVDAYDSDTCKAKQQIDDDLEMARQEKAQAQMGLESLQSTLGSIEYDIAVAKGD